MAKPLASLSLDLDNKWSYLKTHGDRGWEEFPSYLDAVVPCFLELLDRLSLRITVFIVGQDAALEGNQSLLATIAQAGHEIGNHSFHHEPWLHLYSPAQVEAEICAAEDAIRTATGQNTIGFRGPGYSSSPRVLECLARRGYQYDASSLPTVIGPLARAYYFLTARLSPEERRQRRRLFGGWRDGLRPLSPYWWRLGSDMCPAPATRQLLEIPVTTLPLVRLPIHFSYLLFLAQASRRAAWAYWRLAMSSCRAAGIAPSLLLHPLDFLGGDEEPQLGFFPAMRMAGRVKRAFVRDLLADFSQQFHVVTLADHAAALARQERLPVRWVDIDPAEPPGQSSTPSLHAEPALTMELRQ